MTIYGLPNCDSTKAALKWLKIQGVSPTIYDLKSKGITSFQVTKFLEKIPQEKLLNKKSTTWRGLSAAEQATAETKEGTIALLIQFTSLIKRPLIHWDNGQYTVGFDETIYIKNLEREH